MECHPQYNEECNQRDYDRLMDRNPSQNPFKRDQWYRDSIGNGDGEDLLQKAQDCDETYELDLGAKFILKYYEDPMEYRNEHCEYSKWGCRYQMFKLYTAKFCMED